VAYHGEKVITERGSTPIIRLLTEGFQVRVLAEEPTFQRS